jgi:hypothetical protein
MRITPLMLLVAGSLFVANRPSGAADSQQRPESVSGPPLALHVSGNKLLTAAGRTIVLQGVNIPSLEWSTSGENVLRSIRVAMDEWHANIIRIPLNQDRWFGFAPEQKDGGRAYRKLVAAAVDQISKRGGYALLDLHWSDTGEWGRHIGQHKMPDVHSNEFWADAARQFADNPAVMFDLYNEPHDVSWDVWRNGGEVHESPTKGQRDPEITYQSPGMQGLLDVVRKTGAKNVAVAGGLDWAYDLRGIVDGTALDDRGGNGVVYATHIYPWKKDWDKHVTPAIDKVPVFVGEVGWESKKADEASDIWAPKVLAYIKAHDLSWTAWCFHPRASPKMLEDWSYTPTTYWGEYVKKALDEGR